MVPQAYLKHHCYDVIMIQPNPSSLHNVFTLFAGFLSHWEVSNWRHLVKYILIQKKANRFDFFFLFLSQNLNQLVCILVRVSPLQGSKKHIQYVRNCWRGKDYSFSNFFYSGQSHINREIVLTTLPHMHSRFHGPFPLLAIIHNNPTAAITSLAYMEKIGKIFNVFLSVLNAISVKSLFGNGFSYYTFTIPLVSPFHLFCSSLPAGTCFSASWSLPSPSLRILPCQLLIMMLSHMYSLQYLVA